MPILSTKHSYLFLMAPATACTAVGEGVLIPSLDGSYFPAHSVVDDAGGIVLRSKHATVSDLKRSGLLSDGQADTLFKFTTVRNPFDALVTRYVRLRTVWRRELSDPDARIHRLPGMAERIRLAWESPTFSD